MKLHLVDGTFELFRAHFSPRPGHTTPQGRDVKATVGLVSNMLTLLDDKVEAPTHVAIAFDNPIRSFRNDLFEGYKSDEGVPPELRTQFDLVEELVRALGLTAWTMDRFEADDALATAAHRFAPEVEQVRLLTPDKDLTQCVQDTHIVLVDRMRKRVVDEAGVRTQWGVGPALIPDLLALTGDTSDGFPGVPGFGPKTAAALLTAFGSLERIPADAKRWPKTVRGADRLAPVLAAHAEVVFLYRKLATLARDAPVSNSLEDMRVRPLGSPRFEELCKQLGATRLAERVAARG